MDRRFFLKGMGAGSAWAATTLTPLESWATQAVGQGAVIIVHPAELAQAAALARVAADGLAAAGRTFLLQAVPVRDLRNAPAVARLLQGMAGAQVVGVMDDASAVIVQAMAATRGAGFLDERQHRIAGASLVSFVMTV